MSGRRQAPPGRAFGRAGREAFRDFSMFSRPRGARLRPARLLGALAALGALGVVSALAASCAVAQPGDDSLASSIGRACVTKDNCPEELVCSAGHCAPCACPKGDICDPDTGECLSDFAECEVTCLEGTFCSASGDCIDEGTCLADEDCGEEGLVCDTDAQLCVPGSGCIDGEIPSKRLGPNLMILFDRTATMGNVLEGSSETRIEAARKAIISLLEAYEGEVRFGISLFSACTAGGCSPGIVNDPLGSETSTMKLTLEGATPCDSGVSESSIGATLQKFVGYAPLQKEARDNAILLFADSGEQCMGDALAAAKSLAKQPIPVVVHTIGFTDGADEALLQSVASASGEGMFTSAANGAQLKAAAEAAIKTLKSCAYDLAYPPKGDKLHVFFNDEPQEIPLSGLDGWTVNPEGTAIHFHGMACDFILGGNVADVDVVEGCAGPTPD